MSRGFEEIAAFWDEAVGEHGDYFHNHLAYPALFRALGDVDGLEIVDLGSGNGASSRALARAGARVTGVEASASLAERARGYEERTPLGIEYIVSDASSMPMLPDSRFDRVTSNMVLMDVDDCAGLIAEVGRILKPGGRFVSTLFHPCFETPGGSSWLTERIDFDEVVSRRIWRYYEVYEYALLAKPDQPLPQPAYHRPLSWYIEQLVSAGLLVDHFDEAQPDETYQAEHPEFCARMRITPILIALGARKAG